MLERWEEFITSIRKTWSSRIPWRMRAKSWMCHRILPVSKGIPGAHKTILKHQDTRVSLKPTNPRDPALGRLNPDITKISLQIRVPSVDALQFGAHTDTHTPSNENSGCESRIWKRVRKARKSASMASDESQKQKRGHPKGTKTEGQFILLRLWTYATSRTRSWSKSSKHSKVV